MIRKSLLIGGFILISLLPALAKEGMWLPTLLNKYNIGQMKQMGFKLTADDIYSVNQASMKDAVVLFGTGCTGELISDQGLLITNHHCGFDAIQNHSSLEHDYLTNGFWAKTHQEELSNPGLSVRFLDRMEDVTKKVMAGTEGKPADSVVVIINRNSKKIAKEALAKGRYEASVQSLFNGNQYFIRCLKMFVWLELLHHRLVNLEAIPIIGCGLVIPATFRFSGFMPTKTISRQSIRPIMCLINLKNSLKYR